MRLSPLASTALLVLATIAVLGVIGLAAMRRGLIPQLIGGPVDEAARSTSTPDLQEFQPEVIRYRVGPGGSTEVLGTELIGPGSLTEIAVLVEPDADVADMQVGFDPTFTAAEWEPAENRQVFLQTSNTGYQEIFVRFRYVDQSISASSTLGVDIDPFAEAATASAEGAHVPSWVRPLSPTELVVRVETGRIERGSLEPYNLENPPEGDDIGSEDGRDVVERDGEPYGLQVSERTDVIRRFDQFVGEELNVDEVLAAGWEVTAAGGASVEVLDATVLSRPAGGGKDADGQDWVTGHDFVLELAEPLGDDLTYTVTSRSGLVGPGTIDARDPSTISVAVRGNQVGFHPGDQSKIAYVGGWVDGPAPVSAGQAFSVRPVDAAGADDAPAGGADSVFDGSLVAGGSNEGSPVLIADFSEVSETGRFQVCVDDLGCSHPFLIDPSVWSDVGASVARAAFYQRSGVALEPPQASFSRPRPYHPDDGFLVNNTTLTQAGVMATGTNAFEEIVAGGTSQPVTEAWGGHFDAGDWDRRIQHVWLVQNAADLVLRYPETFAQWELNIPESGDVVPDILDEALWTLDVYRRMQGRDGSIRGGIEASDHPPPESTSWVDDLAVFAFAPDSWSSYMYAGAAADAAMALRPFDRTRSGDYLVSAVDAFTWAEEQTPESGMEVATADQRLTALASMYRATGDEAYHDAFVALVAELGLDDPATGTEVLSCHQHTTCDAFWVYLNTDAATDASLEALFLERFVTTGDAVVDMGLDNGYRWTSENPFSPRIWGLGASGNPHGVALSRAYELTGDERYRNAMVDSASVTLGANPINRTLITGRGAEPPVHPQITDYKQGGLPAWPGVPVYGFHQLGAGPDDLWSIDVVLGPGGVRPEDPSELPYLWQWYDVDSVAYFNEFTLHQSIADALMTFGTLAATADTP